MATEIKEIGNNDGGSNAGYIRELMLIKKEDILSIKNPIHSAVQGDAYFFTAAMITAKDDAEVAKINFVWRSCEWSESSGSKKSDAYGELITFEISKNEADLIKWVIDNEKHEFLAFIGDRNGQTFIIGNLDVGLELNYTRKISKKNFMAVSLSGIMTVPAFHTSEFDLDSFFGLFEFSGEFNIGAQFN